LGEEELPDRQTLATLVENIDQCVFVVKMAMKASSNTIDFEAGTRCVRDTTLRATAILAQHVAIRSATASRKVDIAARFEICQFDLRRCRVCRLTFGKSAPKPPLGRSSID
jgi:hypothetical protein